MSNESPEDGIFRAGGNWYGNLEESLTEMTGKTLITAFGLGHSSWTQIALELGDRGAADYHSGVCCLPMGILCIRLRHLGRYEVQCLVPMENDND